VRGKICKHHIPHNFREKIATVEKSPSFLIVISSIPAQKRMSNKINKKTKINIITIPKKINKRK